MHRLILLNTPLGNLSDITPRVRQAFTQGKIFIAEDTRNFKSLLNHLSISLQSKRFISFHDHSDSKMVDMILALTEQEDIYLVSDAGSPAISDPAYPLVAQAYQRGITVDSFSGVSALTMALELSGMPVVPATFLGFLPREEKKILTLFKRTLTQGGSFVFFESPRRILKTLELLLRNHRPSHHPLEFRVMRELTKQYQEIVTIKESNDLAEITPRGEFVVVYHVPQQEITVATTEFNQALEQFLASKKSKKDLAKLLAKFSTYSTKELYDRLNN